MTYIAGHDRSQTLLLPESLDDYVGPDNPVRFIKAFGAPVHPDLLPAFAPDNLRLSCKRLLAFPRVSATPLRG